MATTVGTQQDMNELLVRLVELDYDAIEAYDSAIQRLEDAECKRMLTEFREDHRRHTQDLGSILKESGQRVPTSGGAKSLLTKGKVVLGGLAGDKAILQAMKSNEDDTNKAYERAVNTQGLPARVKDVLQRNLGDERRHREWIVQRLSTM
jgi:uncharacterized protein (TIGR02284 family)